MPLQRIALSYDGQFGHPQTDVGIGIWADGSNLALATGATLTTPAGTYLTLAAGPTLDLDGVPIQFYDVGQEIIGDSGGIVIKVPTGDTIDFEINGLGALSIATAGDALTALTIPTVVGAGRALILQGGSGTTSGGTVLIESGNASAADGAPGDVQLDAGTPGTGNANGSVIELTYAASAGSGTGGGVLISQRTAAETTTVQARLAFTGDLVLGTDSVGGFGGGVGYRYRADGAIPVPGTTEFAAGLVTTRGASANYDVKAAQADSLTNARVVGVVRHGASDNDPVVVCCNPGTVIPVQFTAAHAAIARGDPAYLSQTVAGGIQITAPGSGTVSKIVGYFVTALGQDVVGDAYFEYAPEPATTVP